MSENRILLTHDIKTIPALAFAQLQDGQTIPGILLITWDAPIGRVIADLLLLIECSDQAEWDGNLLPPVLITPFQTTTLRINELFGFRRKNDLKGRFLTQHLTNTHD